MGVPCDTNIVVDLITVPTQCFESGRYEDCVRKGLGIKPIISGKLVIGFLRVGINAILRPATVADS